jgi:transposase
MARRIFTSNFKAKVALEAVKGNKTVSQLSSEYGVHPNQIGDWKKRLLSQLPDIFERNISKQEGDHQEQLMEQLYGEIGPLKVAFDWLKKYGFPTRLIRTAGGLSQHIRR